ncbi:MAG: metallophosphoesterase family protein [Edaphobacter sp.]|uniref:metallophosphoesterase family protein n=1 Tax=Edaphobacter sp. TaxID=1934404 RepID=UPI0023886DB8|nr:metallophosphoesterase family protein [Edaphobacter sp.]MDE1175298.1 metallophosphoesterase family protein [Edaphobacter sp.]
MRVAILSDIHGNLTAFDAVVADIKTAAPDLVFHGGDLADGGSCPSEIVDQIRDLGWQGVMGNGDQMLCWPESLEEFATQSSAPPALWSSVREMAAATRDLLGAEHLSWLRELPYAIAAQGFAIVHATPQSCWKAAPTNASNEEICQIYSGLERPIVVLGHVHIPSIRSLSGTLKLLINTGSVGLSFDGDPRASYLLLDDDTPIIRRVDYSVDREVELLSSSKIPHTDWTIRMLRSSSPILP